MSDAINPYEMAKRYGVSLRSSALPMPVIGCTMFYQHAHQSMLDVENAPVTREHYVGDRRIVHIERRKPLVLLSNHWEAMDGE